MANVAELPTWKNRLARRKNGDALPNLQNAMLSLELAPELRNIFRYDSFADRIELTRPLPGMPRDADDALFQDDPAIDWTDDCLTTLNYWLQTQGLESLQRNIVQDAVIAIAKRWTVHPVCDFLNECESEWDGNPRLTEWLSTYLGARDDEAYLASIGPKFLIGAVARVMDPGCQMDTILVLESEQGAGKTSVVQILANNAWASDTTGALDHKDAAIQIQGVWICEMSELSALRRSEQESTKGFISRRVDRYRPPYGRNAISRPRQCVFVATTNENDYLQDPTGARRFWPVECGSIDLQGLKNDIRQLWGEALSRYRTKENWFLDAPERKGAQLEQMARQKMTPVDAIVAEYAASLLAARITRIEMRELLLMAFDVSTKEDPQKAAGLAMQAARMLIRDGWVRQKPTGRGPRRKQEYVYPGDPKENTSQGSHKVAHKAPEPCEPSVDNQPCDSQGSQGSELFEDDIPF